MDEIDRAVETEARLLEFGIRQHSAPARAAVLDCMTCGAEIPAARRAALPGCCLCIGCQIEIERMRR